MPKTAVLVGRDFAGCYGLRALANELERRDVQCQSFLGFGKPVSYSAKKIEAAIKSADFVITGRSSSDELAEVEIAALEAGMSTRKPCFMYSDGWVSLFPWFRDFYEKLACLFVPHKYCADQVSRVFPKVQVVVSGNPEWEEFFPGPNYAQEQKSMRKRLEKLGAPAKASFILAPGSKDLDLNLELWRDVGKAASMVGGNLCLLASMHPGDRSNPTIYRQELSSTVKVPLVFASKEQTGETKELVPVSDFVISSFSTLGDRGACQGKRVINYISPDAFSFLAQQNALLPPRERGIWPPCHKGDSRLVFGSSDELVHAMEEMSNVLGFISYRIAQKLLYRKKPAPGQAVGIMADEIERVLR